MKLSLLVAEHGYSFVNQAEALAKGLADVGIACQIVKINSLHDVSQEIKEFHPSAIVSIGDWHDYKLLVDLPIELGFPVIPWLVADGDGKEFIARYNQLPCVLTTSQHCQTLLIKAGIMADKITVLPEAVDTEYWQPGSEQELLPFLNLLSISHPTLLLPLRFDLAEARQQQVPILFTTGGYATGKGAQEVMVALSKISHDVPWIYLIKTWPGVKSFQYAVKEMELAERLGISESIRYIVGEFSADFMLGLMRACDIYVSPSRHEGFGLPLIEAQLCCKPVITIAATATAETVIHGTTGFLAQPDASAPDIRANTDELAQYLQLLLGNKELRLKMGQQARQHAVKRYHPTIIARQLQKIIEHHVQ